MLHGKMFIQIFQSQSISENANAAIEVPALQTGENNQMTILIQAFKNNETFIQFRTKTISQDWQ